MRFPLQALTAAVGLAAALLAISKGQGARSRALKTIRAVVPYAPGGVADIIARLVEIGRTGDEERRRDHKKCIAVRSGARDRFSAHRASGAGAIFDHECASADPLLRKLNYDPLTSFEPLCYLVNAPTVIVVNSASPYRTLAQLLDDARAKPGQITMASIGPASSFQLGFEMLKRAAKLDMTFVPYPGNAPALDAVWVSR